MQLTTDSIDNPTTKTWIALHDAIVEAVRLITPKELCFRLGITPQYLSEALSGKVSKDGKSRGFRLEWLPIVLEVAPIDAVAAILRAQANVRGFDIERRKVRTPEERLARQTEAIRRLAPGLADLIAEEVGE